MDNISFIDLGRFLKENIKIVLLVMAVALLIFFYTSSVIPIKEKVSTIVITGGMG